MVNAEQLIKLLNFNLTNEKFENAVNLLSEEQWSQVLMANYSDVIQDCVMKHLTTENYANKPQLYEICEAIIKLLAEKCHQGGILFEFLEIIETVKDDDIFTSILKGLQVVVLNQNEKKSKALEYCLNSIEDYIAELPVADYLNSIEEEEERLLESDDEVHRILMMYITLDLFYEPIVARIISGHSDDKIFRSNKWNRRNVLFCFILRLLGKPLFFLDLTFDEKSRKTKTDSRQVAEKMVITMCKLHVDIYQLLQYAEIRCRWPSKDKIDDDLQDIFMHNEKTPLLQLGMLLYLVVSEGIGIENLPKIYNPIYIFQTGIYLVNVMITSNDAVINKGLKLCQKMLQNICASRLTSDELDVAIHREFTENLTKLLVFSPSKRNRMNAIVVLRNYILKFDMQGRYLVIKNILKIVTHKGLIGYLTTMYKDMIFEDLNSNGDVSQFTSGACFKQLLMDYFCNLSGGAECDITDSSDQIIASLNFLIGILLRDKKNCTGIRDIVPSLESGFLSQLRSALDLSRSHFNYEMEQVKAGKSADVNNLLKNTEILNDSAPLGGITNDKKLEMLRSALIMFDLIDSQLARVNEIINRMM